MYVTLLMLALIIFYLLLVSNVCYIYSTPLFSPVVIIPGTGGNRLEAKLVNKPNKPAWYCFSSTSYYFTLWFDLMSPIPGTIKCWIDNIRLEWNLEKKRAENVKGVFTRVKEFGHTVSMESIDTFDVIPYMKPLVDHLITIGYERGKDLRGAPYDFRYSPEYIQDDYYSKLKELIEETYLSNSNRSITIISHSYGCPVTLYFLTLQTPTWKKKYIKQWVALAGAFGGSILEILVYLAGYIEWPLEKVIKSLQIREQQRSFTSNLFLLPSLFAWSNDYVIVRTNKRNYTIDQIDVLLSDAGFPDAVLMRRHIINSSYLMTTSPGIPIHCFHGNEPNSTIKEIQYDDNTGDFPDKPSKIVMGSGDDTVNIESLMLCEMFKDLQNETVTMKELEGVGHLDILWNDIIHSSLSNLLNDTVT